MARNSPARPSNAGSRIARSEQVLELCDRVAVLHGGDRVDVLASASTTEKDLPGDAAADRDRARTGCAPG